MCYSIWLLKKAAVLQEHKLLISSSNKQMGLSKNKHAFENVWTE